MRVPQKPNNIRQNTQRNRVFTEPLRQDPEHVRRFLVHCPCLLMAIPCFIILFFYKRQALLPLPMVTPCEPHPRAFNLLVTFVRQSLLSSRDDLVKLWDAFPADYTVVDFIFTNKSSARLQPIMDLSISLTP